MPELRTRKPTGRAPFPFVLVEGAAFSGKGWSWAQLSASDRVGRTVAIVTGERDGDEYAARFGRNYELAVHDGTYASILEQVRAACDHLEYDDQGRPPVVAIDSATNLWSLLKNEAQLKAYRRAVKNAEQWNKPKPSDIEECQIHMDLWNWVKSRWRRIIDPLMHFDGISVVTARGREVAEVDGRTPTGDSKWKVDAHKSLPYDVDVHIRTLEPRKAMLCGARSVKNEIGPDTKKKLPADWSLEWLIWEVLECDAGGANYTPMSADPDDEAAGGTEPDYSGSHSWKVEWNGIVELCAETSESLQDKFERAMAAFVGVERPQAIEPGNLRRLKRRLENADDVEGAMRRMVKSQLGDDAENDDAPTDYSDQGDWTQHRERIRSLSAAFGYRGVFLDALHARWGVDTLDHVPAEKLEKVADELEDYDDQGDEILLEYMDRQIDRHLEGGEAAE